MKDSNATGKSSQKSSGNGARAGASGMVANSAVKGKRGHSGMYHDIVSSLFNISSAAELEEIFLAAARDGDFAKIEALLKRRNEAIFSIDVRDKSTGNTAVIWAAKRGHVKIVELLLRYGADITLRNYDDQTALEVASPQTRQLLLESADKGGPHRNLLQAAWQGNSRLVRKILAENTVDINVKNADGLTPLLLVTRDVQLFDKLGERLLKGYDPVEVCQNLLQNRADANAADEKGKTALHYVATTKAAKASNLVDLLLEEGCDIDAQDSRYFAPIHSASQSGNVEVLVALLDGGSDANTRGFAGATPLHISALNGHDNVASKLLEYGADVTLVDDSGLTPVDVAKTKRVRNTLKQAWTEATQKKIASNLAPVRAPSEGAAHRSPSPKRKKGGEVIFDSIVPLADLYRRRHERDRSLQTTSVTSVESLTPRRSSTIYTLEKIISNQEKARLAEAQMMKDFTEGRVGMSSRGAIRTPVSNTPRKLTPIKSPRKKSVPQPSVRTGSAKHGYLKKCQSDPARYPQGRVQECHVPVTVLGFDLDDQLQEVKVKKVVHGPSGPGFPARKGHSRNHSDPFTASSASVAESEELGFYAQGRASKASVITIAEEYEDVELGESPPQSRLHPLLRTPSASNKDRLNIPDTIKEGKVSKKPYILDLDQMQLTNTSRSPVIVDGMIYPNSRKVIPPTPTYMTEVSEEELQDSSDFSGDSKESSPRSDDDINMDAGNITRAKSILREGNFDIQATRVRKSDDSGVQTDKTSSKSSSVSSSVSNLSGEESQSVAQSSEKTSVTKTQGNSQKVPSTPVKVFTPTSNVQVGSPKKSTNSKVSSEQSAKLRAAASDTAANKAGAQPTVQKEQGQAGPSQVNKETVPTTGKTQAGAPKSVPPALPPKTVAAQKTKPQTFPKPAMPTPKKERPQEPPPLPPKPNMSAGSGDKSGVASAKSSATYRTALPVPKVNGTVLSNHKGVEQNSANSAQDSPRIQKGTNEPRSAQSTKSATSSAGNNSVTSKPSSGVGAKPKTDSSPTSTAPNVTVVKNTTVVKVMAPGSVTKTANTTISSPKHSATSQKPTAQSNAQPKPAPKPAVNATNKAQQPPNKVKSPPEKPPPLPPKTGTGNANLSSSDEKPLGKCDDTPVAPPRRKRSTPNSDGSANCSPALPRAAQSVAPGPSNAASTSQTPTVKPVTQASTKATPTVVKTQQSPNSPAKSAASIQTSSIATISKSEMTPVTSTNISGSQSSTTTAPDKPESKDPVVKVRQICVKPAAPTEEPKKEPEKATISTTRKGPVSHSGPQITDAFESLRKEQEREVRAIMGNNRKEVDGNKASNVKQPNRVVPRSAIKPKNVSLGAASSKKKGSAPARQSSAGKKKGKSKNKVTSGVIQENDDCIVKTRPKSGKRVKRKGKSKAGPSFRDKIVLLDKTDPTNRTFISGIGWQIETECDDKSDVHAVVMKFDESDSDEEDSPRVRPNYLDDMENNPTTSRSTARSEKKKLRDLVLPGQTATSDGSEEEDSDDPDAEVIEDEPVEFFTNSFPKDEDEAHSPSNTLDTNQNHYKSIMEEEKKLREHNPAQAVSNVIQQTVQAISDFSKSVTNEDLENMLGMEEARNAVSKPSVSMKTSKSSESFEKGTSAKSGDKSIEAKPVNTNSSSEAKVKSNLPKSASEPKINSSRKISPRSAKQSSTQPNSKPPVTTNTQTPAKVTPKSGAKEVKEPVKKGPSHAPKTKQREEAEINEIIDEILKTTPDPSLSLSWSTKKKKPNSDTSRSMTKEDLAKSFRQSIEHGTFRELKNSSRAENDMAASVHCTLTKSIDSSLAEMLSKIHAEENLGKSSDLEMLENKHRHLKKRVSAAMMDGLVSPTGNITNRQPVVSKPPPAPKASTNVPRNLDMEETRQSEKSPRFVRKRHEDSLKGNNYGTRGEGKNLDDTGNLSDFGSVSLPRDIDGDDSLVQLDRGEVVTSRLGRRGSMCSRAGSVMTDSTDDVETIQWKRGNMLGKGAYGTVWCGLTNAGELIAVKQIELNIDNMDKAEEEYEKIQEEVELLKTLKHKNIVGYLGTSLEENYVVNIFMQFVPGGSIANLLARFGSLEEEVFCRYTEQILEGVEYLHCNDVIHRDIKGGNIMLMPTGVIKLIDFGCAKRICLNVSNGKHSSDRHSRLLKSMRGTPFWMAPEVVNETGHGTKSDIWSIGCTIFEMATRKPPWSEMAPMAAIFAIGSDNKPVPQLPDKFSSYARDFVNACLTRNPSQRPSAPELLNHPFITKRRKKTGSFS